MKWHDSSIAPLQRNPQRRAALWQTVLRNSLVSVSFLSFFSLFFLFVAIISVIFLRLDANANVLAASAGQNPTILVAPLKHSQQAAQPVATTEPLTDIVPNNIVYLPLVTQDLTIFLPVIFTKSSFQQPTPADNQNGVSLNAYLGWTFDDLRATDTRFTVYLEADDLSPDVELIANLTTTAFDPATFELNTQYFWQVVASLPDGTKQAGPVWRFKTEQSTSAPDVNAMVTVPAGNFQMGCDDNHSAGAVCPDPVRRVYIDAFEIDKYEVTNAEYRACVDARACNPPRRGNSHHRKSYFLDLAYDFYPVLYVSHWDAKAFCAWEGKRLPTEAEWEKAVRGPMDARPWPWGSEMPDCARMNFVDDRDPNAWYACVDDTSPVGATPRGASPYGAMDMAGNVMEWVLDYYDPTYYSWAPDVNPTGPIDPSIELPPDEYGGPYFSVRGGSYRPRWFYARTFHRQHGHHGDTRGDDSPLYRNDKVGFRCARSFDD